MWGTAWPGPGGGEGLPLRAPRSRDVQGGSAPLSSSRRWMSHAAWAQGLEPAARSVAAGLREGGSTSCARNGRQDKRGGEPGPGAHLHSSQGRLREGSVDAAAGLQAPR